MTYAGISQMISAVGIPYAYHHFEEGSGQQPPFITFYYQGDNDFVADNINYAAIRPLTIELYTDNKDFALEAAVESVLTANDLAFSRTEVFIDSEQMYMVTYNTEVLINA
jgi:hypothetical protein